MKLAWRVLAGFLILALIVWPVMYLKPLWVADQEVRFKLWREGVDTRCAITRLSSDVVGSLRKSFAKT